MISRKLEAYATQKPDSYFSNDVYIFNMFTCRESAPWNEPPFEVLRDLG